MKTYAQVIRGKVHWIGKSKVLPEDKTGGPFIDVEDVKPKPKEGWLYSFATNTFSKPVVVPIEYIDIKTLSQDKINAMILRKLGYNIAKVENETVVEEV